MARSTDYQGHEKPTWCPNCGDFGILAALKMAMADLNLPTHETVVVSGIGCSGKMPHYIKTYGFEGIHGRVLPVATGVKLSNHKLNVIGIGGDGDGYGIGMGHFIHAMRRNLNLTYIVHNNQVYGLTKGQTSPTSEHHYTSPSTPDGVIELPVNPLALALASEATFIARGFSKNLVELRDIIKAGIQHRGFSLIDVLQPCVTYNHLNTYAWYQQRIYSLAKEGYVPGDKAQAWLKALEWGDRIPLGVIYKEDRPTYEDEVVSIQTDALVHRDASNNDIRPLLDKLR
jgi:2-oxoglutarate ferredoxin oxidoreductase subunit beta